MKTNQFKNKINKSASILALTFSLSLIFSACSGGGNRNNEFFSADAVVKKQELYLILNLIDQKMTTSGSGIYSLNMTAKTVNFDYRNEKVSVNSYTHTSDHYNVYNELMSVAPSVYTVPPRSTLYPYRSSYVGYSVNINRPYAACDKSFCFAYEATHPYFDQNWVQIPQSLNDFTLVGSDYVFPESNFYYDYVIGRSEPFYNNNDNQLIYSYDAPIELGYNMPNVSGDDLYMEGYFPGFHYDPYTGQVSGYRVFIDYPFSFDKIEDITASLQIYVEYDPSSGAWYGLLHDGFYSYVDFWYATGNFGQTYGEFQIFDESNLRPL